MKVPKFNFIRDEPLDKNSESFFNFYHSAIAPALVKILKSASAPHTIGIFGSWGTGKSTIINMLKSDTRLKTPIFIFDAWKYQEDSLRRTFLIKLVEFLKSKEVGIDFEDNFLSDMYHATEQRAEVPLEEGSFSSKVGSWIKKNVLLSILVLLIVATTIVILLTPQHPGLKIVNDVLNYLSSITILALFASIFLGKVFERVGDILLQNSKATKSSMMNITFKDKLNSPEEFEEKFKDILLKLRKTKLIVVFDNIDRVQGDVAVSMISTIKTFMEPNNKSRVIFIIPCDPDAIDEQIVQFYTGDKNVSAGYQSSEYLRKVFNLIIWLPDYINTDLEEYTSKCLEATGEISSLLHNNDVVLVINSAFSRNPREIIQFVNNLTALTIAAHSSGVANHIVNNIAYLAKTQVIKQKFPAGYKRLQSSWNNPEAIYEVESTSTEEIALKEFMLATSRITAEDAEPFIYFKDPLGARGLKDSNSLLAALLEGNEETAAECVKYESNNAAVAKFTLDVMNKYKGIPRTLVAIYNVQYKNVYDIVPDTYKSRYVDNLAKLVDTHLWSRFSELDTDMTFRLMSESSLDKDLVKALKTRYLNILKPLDGGKSPSTDILKKIVANIRDRKTIFNNQEISEVRESIESNAALANNALELFTSHDLQEEFINENLFLDFVQSIDSTNVTTRIKQVALYSSYIKSHGLIPDVSDAFSKSLEKDSQNNPSQAKHLVPYTSALGDIIKLDRDEIKKDAYQPQLTLIHSSLMNSLSVAEDESVTANVLIGLWWLYGSAQAYNDTIVNTISTQMASLGIGGIKTFFSYWDKTTKESIVRQTLPTLLQRVIVEKSVLEYIYEIADVDSKKAIVTHLIKNKPRPDDSTFDFLTENTDAANIEDVTLAIREVQRANAFLDEKYVEFVLQKLRKNSSRASKDSIIQLMKEFLKQEDPSNKATGIRLLRKENFLSSEDKKTLAEELLEYLESRSGVVDSEQLELLNFIVSELTSTSYHRRLSLLALNWLKFASTPEITESIFNYLNQLKARFKAYESEVREIYQYISSQSETESKKKCIELLVNLRTPRPSKAEKIFWEEVKNYYTPED